MRLYHDGKTYLFRGQQSHTSSDPASSAGSQGKSLLDTESLHDLQVHDSRVPVGEVLRLCACGAMAERLDGEQVDGIGQVLCSKLRLKERRGCAHGVDEHEGGLAGVDSRARDTIAGIDASEVGNTDGSFGGHFWYTMVLIRVYSKKREIERRNQE